MTESTKHIRRKIYIEAEALCREQPTGVAYWAEGLIKGLVDDMPDVDFVFFHFAGTEHQLRIAGKNVKEVIIPKLSARSFRLLYLIGLAPSLERLLGLNEVSTVIFPNFYAWPVRTPGANIITLIPDTTFLDVPEYVPHAYFRRLLDKGVRYSCRVSSRIIVCSDFTRHSIVRHYSRSQDTIDVAYPGHEPYEKKHPNTKLAIPKKFILFVGTLEPRKNVANLIRGYILLNSNIRHEYPLLLAGGKGWLDAEINQLIEMHSDDGVTALGYVSDADRSALYSAATVFAYPVRYEGFGMPIIEAQAHGLPILSTDNSSLPEATGGKAVFCDTSASGIASGLKSLLEDKSLRSRLAREGRVNAATFNWRRSQKVLRDAIDRNSYK